MDNKDFTHFDENGKAIMVPGSNAYIFCSRQFYCLHPLVGIEVHRIEPSCQFLILLVIDLLVVHYPLTVTQHGVDSPMDEYSKTGLSKLLSALHVLWRGNISGLC